MLKEDVVRLHFESTADVAFALKLLGGAQAHQANALGTAPDPVCTHSTILQVEARVESPMTMRTRS